MKLKLGKENYEMYLGLAFINYLDGKYHVEESGIKFGMGLQAIYNLLELRQLDGIIHFIKAGTIIEKSKPSNKDLEDYLTKLTDEEYDNLFKEAMEELKKQPLTGRQIDFAAIEEAKKKAEQVKEEKA